MTDVDLMLRFMLQVIVVLTTCKAIGWFGRRYLKQAQVTMEMLAGVLLGPSVLGALAPSLQQYLFPQFLVAGVASSGKHPSMSILYVIAQIGLTLYMFVVGLEIDLNLVKVQTKSAISVSLAGILLPLLLGMGLYLLILQGRNDMFDPAISSGTAALYLGAAMCITAFPVLARIIYDSGIAGTSLGALALGAGAMDDVVAWILLAIVLTVSKGNVAIASWAIGGGIAFCVVTFTILRKAIQWLERREADQAEVSPSTFGLILIVLFLGSWFTDAIGVYAVFGAFLLGMAMPRGRLSKQVQKKVEPLAIGLFLPFFFVYSGLNTKLGSLTTASHWLIVGAVLVVAIGGKLGGCYMAARACKESHSQSMAVGVLMNARGLMELIVLNIGLQQKLITISLYTIMVIMAIVTTFMAAPLFEMVYRRRSAIPQGDTLVAS